MIQVVIDSTALQNLHTFNIDYYDYDFFYYQLWLLLHIKWALKNKYRLIDNPFTKCKELRKEGKDKNSINNENKVKQFESK